MRSVSISLGWSLAVALVGGSVAVAPVAAPAQTVSSGTVLQVNTGRGRLVTLTRPMSDVFVADDKIADVQVRSPTQLYVFGKSRGETTVYATDKSGRVVYAANVRVGTNIGSVEEMLRLAMPEAQVQVTPMNNLVLLTGTVASPEDAAEAARLTQAYVGEGTQVVSRLRSAVPLQVNLRVRIVEVNRTLLKQIGVNLFSGDSTSGFKFGIGQGASTATTGPVSSPFSVGSLLTGGTTLGMAGRLFGLDLAGALDLAAKDGLVTVLAEPNLTALSGETASFLAGGEFPIPVAQQAGAVTV